MSGEKYALWNGGGVVVAVVWLGWLGWFSRCVVALCTTQ